MSLTKLSKNKQTNTHTNKQTNKQTQKQQRLTEQLKLTRKSYFTKPAQTEIYIYTILKYNLYIPGSLGVYVKVILPSTCSTTSVNTGSSGVFSTSRSSLFGLSLNTSTRYSRTPDKASDQPSHRIIIADCKITSAMM